MPSSVHNSFEPQKSRGRFGVTAGGAFKYILWRAPKYILWSSSFANFKIRGAKIKHLFVAAALMTGTGRVLDDHWGNFIVYSHGHRTGTPYKLSYKGFPLSSWEGQLSVSGLRANDNGGMSNAFEYSVLSCEIRDQLEAAQAKQLTIEVSYAQTKSHWSWNRDTDYIAQSVIDVATEQSVVGDPKLPKTPRGWQEKLFGCSLNMLDHL